MTTRTHGYLGSNQIRRMNRQEMQTTVVQGTVAVLAASSVLLWWYLLPRDAPDIAVFCLVPTAFAVLVWCYRVSRSAPDCASAMLVAATYAGAAALHGLVDPTQEGLLFALPLVLAAALFHPAASILLGALSLPWLAGLGPGEPRPLAMIAMAVVAICTWVAMRPLHSLLQWSWRRSAEATLLAEMLRDRQEELNRSIASLDLTNRLLQRTNHELALARHEADEARRVKEEFAAGISHELRTPLNIILGFTEIMHESPEVYGEVRWPATLRRDVTEVYRSARYLSDMIDDVLDLARVEAALMPVHREPTDLHVVVAEALDISRGLVRDGRVALEAQVAPDLPELLIDRARIRQVILNLLANASRYTEAGSIRVSAWQDAGQVVVAVADTGIGIPAEQLDSIFSEFRQVDPGRDSERQGKGLGLAIAKRFVQLHGGSIWVKSTVGKGSSFYFSLPMERKDFSRLRQTEPTRLPANPYRECLVVLDGDDLSSSYLRRQLDGHEVLWARDRHSLQELCDSRHPKAIVVNAGAQSQRPAETGPLPAAVPVITCSLPTRSVAMSRGPFRAVLAKPVSGATLLEALGALTPTGEVLVVDDDRAFVQLVMRTLQASRSGYSLRWAYSGDEALSKLRTKPADAVVLDVMMPGMDGIALAEAMAADESLAAIPLLAVTGANLDKDTPSPLHGSFHVEQGRGLGEKEMLGLLRASLQVLRADYVTAPDSAPVTPGTPA